MRTPLIASAAIVVFGLGLARAEPVYPVIYVNSQAVGVNDGSSWADAFIDLQDALQLARTMPVEPVQIWIAGGSYKPDRGTGDRNATFDLCDSLQMYGGFAGWESCLDERIRGAHPTVLDGDLLGDDDPNAEAASNCCALRFLDPGCDNPQCESIVGQLHPKCLTDGWEGDCVDEAVFRCPELCRPTRADNTHVLMRAFNLEGTVVLDQLTIRGGDGNCHWNCPAVGGITATNVDLVVTNCEFLENSGDNTAALSASGFRNVLVIEDCVFQSNGDYIRTPAAVRLGIDGLTLIADSEFRENRSFALFLQGIGAQVRRCRFVNNHSQALGDFGQLTSIWDSEFSGNSHYNWSAVSTSLFPTQFINCTFMGNRTEIHTSALDALGASVLLNCSFIGNSAGNHPKTSGSIVVLGLMGPALVLNNTSFANTLTSVSSTFYVGSTSYVADSVFWGNSTNGAFDQRAQIDLDESETYALLHNNIMGWTGSLGGVGNVDLDPQFVDPDGPDDVIGTPDDNLRLSPGSPLIDLGDPDPDLYPYLDADGHNRILRGRIDMGAYEYGIGDIDEDDAFTLADLRYFWACMYGPDSPANLGECIAFDFHAQPDDRIDLLDFAGVQTAFAAGP